MTNQPLDALQDQTVPYFLLGFEFPTSAAWLLYGFRVGDQEQLLADTGVPVQVIDGPLAGARILVRREPVILTMGHRMKGPRDLRVCMPIRLQQQRLE